MELSNKRDLESVPEKGHWVMSLQGLAENGPHPPPPFSPSSCLSRGPLERRKFEIPKSCLPQNMFYSCITFVFPIVNKKMVRKWLQNSVGGLEECPGVCHFFAWMMDAVWAWRRGRLSRVFHSQDLENKTATAHYRPLRHWPLTQGWALMPVHTALPGHLAPFPGATKTKAEWRSQSQARPRLCIVQSPVLCTELG